MKDIQIEISRNIPEDKLIRLNLSENTIPLFTAYGCVLLERDTGKRYIYTAVNLKSGRREVIRRSENPLTTSGVDTIAEKIRMSKISGAGRLVAERAFGDKIALEKCREILLTIFREIMPQHGFTIRKEQISLSENILNSINRRKILLAEAEVGTGKTIAYLLPAIIAKCGRLNEYWNMSFYTGTPYVEMANMPVVIATSSIALQKAIVKDCIPLLSEILLKHRIIKKPITAVIRKGREHYICERNLQAHIMFEHNPDMKQILVALTEPSAPIDLAETDGLTPHVKRKIAVPKRCDKHCPYRGNCSYLCFREQVQSSAIDIQVCNHNYLLADTLRRNNAKSPLIPNYQCIIIDEAHKFLQAARSMYGVELSSLTMQEIKDGIYGLNFKNENNKYMIQTTAKKLSYESSRLFNRLHENINYDETDEETDRFAAVFDDDTTRHFRNIRDIAIRLIELLNSETLVGKGMGLRSQVLWELEQLREQADVFAHHDSLICWIEIPNRHIKPGVESETLLCAIPKNLDEKLHADLWSKSIPTVLTSGTLSAAGDFSHIKRTLGIERVNNKIVETSKPSPFDYQKNTMLYLSRNVPFPDQSDSKYILAVANEVEKLIQVSHGHAAVLFTSYKAMDMVWEILEKRGLPFPMFRLNKGGIKEIDRFKKSGNGVLFASGAMWEGIDIPGDALSMLIIVKLPFAVPDPIGEYERTLYKDMQEYIGCVIIPEMLIKLKQGFGRLIRTETDTGVAAILDIRANENGAYYDYVINALPKCRVTKDIEEVKNFILTKKPSEYYYINAKNT